MCVCVCVWVFHSRMSYTHQGCGFVSCCVSRQGASLYIVFWACMFSSSGIIVHIVCMLRLVCVCVCVLLHYPWGLFLCEQASNTGVTDVGQAIKGDCCILYRVPHDVILCVCLRVCLCVCRGVCTLYKCTVSTFEVYFVCVYAWKETTLRSHYLGWVSLL